MFLLEIAKHLESKNLGTLTVDLFVGEMPEEPANCVAIFEYAGAAPDLHWNGEYPGLQVRVRGETYLEGRTKIGQIYEALHGLHDVILSAKDEEDGEGGGEGDSEETQGTRYLLIKAFGSPELLKKYPDGWVEFVQHFEVIKER